MQSGFSIASIFVVAVLLSACAGSHVRKEIEGNNTGGVIPPALAAGKDVQQLASAHCAKWNTQARITFSGADAGGDTVFVCETSYGPAMMAGSHQSGQPAPGAPAAKGPSVISR